MPDRFGRMKIHEAPRRTECTERGWGDDPEPAQGSKDRRRARDRSTWSVVCALALVVSACAARMPPAPAVPAYPDFMYPAVPGAPATQKAALRLDRGWRYLQGGDLAAAEREFASALERNPSFYPALAAQGYAALAGRGFDPALERFDRALGHAGAYVPALVGRGQALLAASRRDEAILAFEAALTADPSLIDLSSRVEVLRFRSVQESIDRARAAAASGDVAEARRGYLAALASSPDSAFLHRELGIAEQQAGNADAALAQFKRAAELDPSDAPSLIEIAALLVDRGDLDAAVAWYRRAADIEPSEDLTARIAALTEQAREAQLPPEFKAIAELPQLTRADLAALIGVRLEKVLRSAPVTQILITDTRNHWSAGWIATVAAAGVMDLFENYSFRPRAVVRRVDLADVVRRIVMLMDPSRPGLSPTSAARPAIADVTPSHLDYPAVSFAVTSGLMSLLDGRRFQVSRAVSGAEAIDVVARLRAMDARGR